MRTVGFSVSRDSRFAFVLCQQRDDSREGFYLRPLEMHAMTLQACNSVVQMFKVMHMCSADRFHPAIIA